MFDLDPISEVFPNTPDLFSDDNDLPEEKSGRLNTRNRSSSDANRWREEEIRVVLAAYSRHKYLNPDELDRISWQMRQGNTPAVITKWFKSCRAHQGKTVRQERARRRDARYTKAK
eukprot:Phypoly_transcript_19390.p1 GENE.Phypoly_transcript_19390~~Phypoly_transcript_19390.p1  ORF type:complete len:116 (+),score=13.12 Phypoly_transcript_19390:171-518(+)